MPFLYRSYTILIPFLDHSLETVPRPFLDHSYTVLRQFLEHSLETVLRRFFRDHSFKLFLNLSLPVLIRLVDSYFTLLTLLTESFNSYSLTRGHELSHIDATPATVRPLRNSGTRSGCRCWRLKCQKPGLTQRKTFKA